MAQRVGDQWGDNRGGGTATLSVQLASQSTAYVTIGLSSSDTTEGTVSPSSLAFTSANWDTPQVVIVRGVDDTLIDSSIGYTIITSAASSVDQLNNGLQTADVTLLNTDNDQASAGQLLVYLALIQR